MYELHGGRTDLNNLLLLCERHHVAHHAGQFHIFTTDSPGRFRFISADGHNLSAPHQRPTNTDTRPLEDEYTGLAADAPTPKWDGQRLDHRYAISVLAQRRHAAS